MQKDFMTPETHRRIHDFGYRHPHGVFVVTTEVRFEKVQTAGTTWPIADLPRTVGHFKFSVQAPWFRIEKIMLNGQELPAAYIVAKEPELLGSIKMSILEMN